MPIRNKALSEQLRTIPLRLLIFICPILDKLCLQNGQLSQGFQKCVSLEMEYQLYAIDPLLQPFIKVICSVDNRSPVIVPNQIRVLPDTCVELFINLCKPQQIATPDGNMPSLSRSFVTSRMNSFMDVSTQGNVSFVSVCFASGQAYRFFPVSMHDIANQAIDLRDLWGTSADDMQERIDKATTMLERISLIQQYLIQQLYKSVSVDTSVDFCLRRMQQTNGQLLLDELANQVGISNRQLARRFNQYVGLSPKEFARITTFTTSLINLKKYPSLTLTEIAYDSGYYDQAHFIRACRTYSGLTPSQLVNNDQILYCF